MYSVLTSNIVSNVFRAMHNDSRAYCTRTNTAQTRHPAKQLDFRATPPPRPLPHGREERTRAISYMAHSTREAGERDRKPPLGPGLRFLLRSAQRCERRLGVRARARRP